MKTPLLATGLSGLVGSRMAELLSPYFEFENLSRSAGTDITDFSAVEEKISKSPSEWILHLAGKTDVEACEKDKAEGKSGEAWKINVGGTENIVKVAKESGKKVLFISTDFVFDGEKDFYTEEDAPHPINWYGTTKTAAELAVLKNDENSIARISYPYRGGKVTKADFLHAIAKRLKEKKEVQALTDHIFTPTFIDDIAFAVKKLIETKSRGIFHVVGKSFLTPYAASQEIAATFGFNEILIKPTTRKEYFLEKAERPFKLRLKSDKIVSLGIYMHTFGAALTSIKQQGLIL